MEFEGVTYRPPMEADTMLLQVTVGCSHNRCSFCAMYRDVRFRVAKMDQIEKDLQYAKYVCQRAGRIFLVNGDAFVLKAAALKEIAIKIKEYLPECKTISMYASIRNIKTKTDEELKELKALGVNDLYVGVESGSDEVLARLNKGNTVEEAQTQLERLNKVGINHMSLLMLGAAGRGKGMENARLTAEFLNSVKPKLVWAGKMTVFEETELSREAEAGLFALAPEMEILMEEKELLKNIQLENIHFYGDHPTNTIPVSGRLPKDKQRMIDTIDKGVVYYGDRALSGVFQRKAL